MARPDGVHLTYKEPTDTRDGQWSVQSMHGDRIGLIRELWINDDLMIFECNVDVPGHGLLSIGRARRLDEALRAVLSIAQAVLPPEGME